MNCKLTLGLITISLGLFGPSSNAMAQQSSPAANAVQIQIQRAAAGFRVRIPTSTSLEAVLKGLCGEANGRCDGLALTSQIMVSPSEIKGTWNEIIARLLEGAKLNYIAESPSLQATASLVIESQPSGEESSIPPHDDPMVQNTSAPSVADNSEIQNNIPASEMQSNIPVSESASVAVLGRDPSTFNRRLTVPEAVPGSVLTGATPPANAELPQFLPFPDNGRPIPVPTTNAQPEFLPFPDNGKPIPVDPNSPPGAPYPGTQPTSPH